MRPSPVRASGSNPGRRLTSRCSSGETFELVVQVNGKRRGQIEVAADTPESQLLELARSNENVSRHLEGKQTVKEIVVPGKLVNFVVRG